MPHAVEFNRQVSRVVRPRSQEPYVVVPPGDFIPYSYLYQINLVGYVNVDQRALQDILEQEWRKLYPGTQSKL